VVEKEDSRKREIVRTKKVEDRYYKCVSDVHQSNDLIFFWLKNRFRVEDKPELKLRVRLIFHLQV
jgi:hypothetical protein